MKRILNVTLAAAVLGIVVFSSCSKGTTGPAGPQGPAGPDSVYTSNWIVLNMTQQIPQAGDTTYNQTIAAPAITAGILDSGVVILYFAYIDNNGNTDVEPAENYLEAVYTAGSIELISYTFDYSNEAEIRYVVIPGKVIAGTSIDNPFKGMSKSQITNLSYQQVTKMLGQTTNTRSAN